MLGELEVGVGESCVAPHVCHRCLEKEPRQQNGAELKLLGRVQREEVQMSDLEVVCPKLVISCSVALPQECHQEDQSRCQENKMFHPCYLESYFAQ